MQVGRLFLFKTLLMDIYGSASKIWIINQLFTRHLAEMVLKLERPSLEAVIVLVAQSVRDFTHVNCEKRTGKLMSVMNEIIRTLELFFFASESTTLTIIYCLSRNTRWFRSCGLFLSCLFTRMEFWKVLNCCNQ